MYHWQETSQYDPESKEGGLFAPFINTFLQMKQEASGWPTWCETPEDKKKYVDDYLQNEGVKLNPDNIKKNPGLRSLAKLLLNRYVEFYMNHNESLYMWIIV